MVRPGDRQCGPWCDGVHEVARPGDGPVSRFSLTRRLARRTRPRCASVVRERCGIVVRTGVDKGVGYGHNDHMTDRAAASQALAKSIAYENCGKTAKAQAWAVRLMELIGQDDLLRPYTPLQPGELN